MAWLEAGVESPASGDQARGVLATFRGELYRCLTARADALFELADAALCADGPVRMLAALSLEPEHRRGHGAAYDAVNPAGGRCEQLAAARRGDQPGADVLPRLRARQGERADDPGLAVLLHRRAGTWPHLLDGGAGRGPARVLPAVQERTCRPGYGWP
jgi:hypothetical protein